MLSAEDRVANSESAYTHYAQWKGWNESSFGRYSKKKAREFGRQSGVDCLQGKKILEIGFGSGAFMMWARDQGADVVGLEIQSELRHFAAQAGFKVTESIDSLSGERFDFIFAFDVLEHLTLPDLESLLCKLKLENILGAESMLVFKVPNAASPFAMGMQYGDITHKTHFTPSSVRQLCENCGYRLLGTREHIPPWPGGIAWIRSLLRATVRKLFTTIFGFGWDLTPDTFHQCQIHTIQPG